MDTIPSLAKTDTLILPNVGSRVDLGCPPFGLDQGGERCVCRCHSRPFSHPAGRAGEHGPAGEIRALHRLFGHRPPARAGDTRQTRTARRGWLSSRTGLPHGGPADLGAGPSSAGERCGRRRGICNPRGSDRRLAPQKRRRRGAFSQIVVAKSPSSSRDVMRPKSVGQSRSYWSHCQDATRLDKVRGVCVNVRSSWAAWSLYPCINHHFRTQRQSTVKFEPRRT